MSKRAVVLLLLVCVSAIAIAAAVAQSKAPSPEKKTPEHKTSGSSIYDQAKAAASQSGNGGATSIGSSTKSAQAEDDYNVEYWKYQVKVLEHSRKVYAWQHISSIIIFYVVVFLVLVGVVFSWLQFRAAAFKGESEELDANLKGVKITSSTLGVVILVLSMCFFFLYLRYVYPVNLNGATKLASDTSETVDH